MKIPESVKPMGPNPRQLLTAELERRCRENPRYSLRAFARALEMSPSALSLFMTGRRGLSKTAADTICKKLGLDLHSTQRFIHHSLKRGRGSVDFTNFTQLSLDKFSVISEWYHFGILSLIEIKEFKADPTWIASRLGVSVAEIKSAVGRLVRLGILDNSTSRWKQIGQPIFVNNEVPSAATKRHQRQLLDKAIYSLENDPFEVREVNAVTMAIDPKNVPEARKKIRSFLIDLMENLEKKGNPQEVYNLGIQLFPVSKRSN